MNTIYVYSTKTYIKNNWLKVGQTSHSDSVTRIEQQDGTSNPEPLIPLYECQSNYTDKHIHAQLIKNGLFQTREDKRREWFTCTLDDVKKAINELETGIQRVGNFSMRDEQRQCRDQAVKYFNNGGTKFLMDAKMRFGKTFTSYQIMKSLKAKRVLILTYKTAVAASWAEDLENHVDFDGYTFNKIEDGENGDGVYFSSMQGIMAGDRIDSDKRKWINGIEWDLIIFDEEHYGSRSENAIKIKKALKNIDTKWLNLSGTPFQARLGNEYEDDATFQWTYTDEQKAKRNWHTKNCANQCVC